MSVNTNPRRVVTFLLAWVLAGACLAAEDRAVVRAEDVGMSNERLGKLSDAMDGYVERGDLAGAVVLIARRGEIVFHQAFGERDREQGDAMETSDIFRIASQTKALVSTAILILEEDGKLLISHPVSRYLPSFKQTTVAEDREGGRYDIVPAKREITLRDLLTHTAGVSYGDGPTAYLWERAEIQGWYFANRDELVRATIDRLAALPFDAHPGEKFIYGYSTDILGAVVEVASGKPLDEFLSTRIFEPLGMRDTQFYLPPDEADRLATVYSAADSGLQRAPDPGHMVGQGNYVNGPRKSFSGGAGLTSTAHDYSRFLQMMLGGGELDGTRILSRKTVELMTTNHVGEKYRPGLGFGLGYRVVLDVGAMGEHSSVGEFGWGGAYHSTYWVDPSEQLVVVYMTQLIPAGGLDDQKTLRALVYSAIID